MSLLKDTFLYFAKYPEHGGVMKNFNRDTSVLDGYSSFKTDASNIPVKSIIPDITDYVFGIDETTVIKKIKEIAGEYMFLDYGNIPMSHDGIRENTEFLIALHVARPMNVKGLDFAEEIVLADEMLEHIKTIRDHMKDDQRNNPFVKHLSHPHEITPFFARELSNSVGWTLLFRIKGIEIL